MVKPAQCKSDPTIVPVLPVATAQDAFEGLRLAPGVERWPVKTGSDPDAAQVQDRRSATVEQLVGLPRPTDMPVAQKFAAKYQNHRAAPVENTIWRVEADLVALKLEADGDYHLVIKGATGQTMVAEVPNPTPPFVNPASPWARQIAEARAAIDERLAPTPKLMRTSQRLRIDGIGFFDRVGGQSGMAPNGIELHPVISIDFLQKEEP